MHVGSVSLFFYYYHTLAGFLPTVNCRPFFFHNFLKAKSSAILNNCIQTKNISTATATTTSIHTGTITKTDIRTRVRNNNMTHQEQQPQGLK
jgi:hypothetical protein